MEAERFGTLASVPQATLPGRAWRLDHHRSAYLRARFACAVRTNSRLRFGLTYNRRVTSLPSVPNLVSLPGGEFLMGNDAGRPTNNPRTECLSHHSVPL